MTLLAVIHRDLAVQGNERARRICPERYGIRGPIVMTMRWVLEIRRVPSLTRLSRAVLKGRAGNSQRLIEMDRTADPLKVSGDRRECRPIHTDRRGEACGNRGATVVRPVGRKSRAWRDCSSSQGWRSWWLTPAGLGCSTRARRESSRLKHWAYSWHPFADCSKREGPTISATRQARWRGGGTDRRTVRGFCQNSTTL
jgi:hypothetical protein